MLKTNVYCRLGFFLVVGRLVFAMLPDFHLGTEPTRFDETLFTDSVAVSQHFLPRDHYVCLKSRPFNSGCLVVTYVQSFASLTTLLFTDF